MEKLFLDWSFLGDKNPPWLGENCIMAGEKRGSVSNLTCSEFGKLRAYGVRMDVQMCLDHSSSFLIQEHIAVQSGDTNGRGR